MTLKGQNTVHLNMKLTYSDVAEMAAEELTYKREPVNEVKLYCTVYVSVSCPVIIGMPRMSKGVRAERMSGGPATSAIQI